MVIISSLIFNFDIRNISTEAASEKVTSYELMEKIGVTGSGNGQFKGPIGLAIDSFQNLYVVDSENHRVQKFDSNGTFITTWGQMGSLEGEFETPEGIAIDSRGNVYVTDSYNHNVQKFDNDGNFITKWGTFGVGQGQFGAERSPVGIAIDSQDNVYVADYYNDKIQKFDNDGNFILFFDKGVYAVDNALYGPQAIAIDSKDMVYVADSDNNRLQIYDSDGNLIKTWASQHNGKNTLQIPEGIAVDSFDNIYVNDFHHERIQKFYNNGTFVTKWETSGIKGTQSEAGLGGIAVNSEGIVFVSQFGKNRVEVFAPTEINSVPNNIKDNNHDKTMSPTKEDKSATPPLSPTKGITDQM